MKHLSSRRLVPAAWVALLALAGCDSVPPPSSAASATAASSASAPPAASASAAAATPQPFETFAESFADVQILRYRIEDWEGLSAQQKALLYHLYEAARAGRDIIWDQKNRHNLLVRRTLEAIWRAHEGKQNDDLEAIREYTKKVWFARGIHHDYSAKKFEPSFSKEAFAKAVKAADPKALPLDAPPGSEEKLTVDQLIEKLTPIIFDPEVDPMRVNRAKDADVIATSSNNFYDPDLTQAEVEAYYAKKIDKEDETPVMYGLNSKLVKEGDELVEKVWKVGGMYSPAIEKIVAHLKQAIPLAENDAQKDALTKLVAFYESGKLEDFDAYNIAWVKDTDSRIDNVNGFIETYDDALGYRATFESVVSIKDLKRTKRIATIGGEAQWFEDNSPIADNHKKKEVKGISAKVITIVAEGGDTAPTTPIGINLPNSNWIRKDHGSKSVFLGNIVDAHQEVQGSSGLLEEFALTEEEVARYKEFGKLGYALKVDMHEVIGHASGQLEEGVGTPKETLKNYASALEEARADLVALYYVMDPKLIELGIMKSLEVGKAAYDGYIRNGLLTQLARIEPGEQIEQSHMRNRAMISNWVLDKGKDDKVIERVDQDGDVYFVVRDYDKLRKLFGELLAEVQRIKSEGDFEAGKNLIETYGVKVDEAIHQNVRERYAKTKAKQFSGFIQPELEAVKKDGKIVDVKVTYPDDFAEQQLRFSKKYSTLPTYN